MGYVDYFLIVWDFIKYARDNDIMVGPGARLRGRKSGGVHLGITQLDPIRYDLLLSAFSIRNECPCRILTWTSVLSGGRKS